MTLENDIKNKLMSEGAEFAHFVDISRLSEKQNKGFWILE